MAEMTESCYKVSDLQIEMTEAAPKNSEVFSLKSFIKQRSLRQTQNTGILYFQLSDSECLVVEVFNRVL